jgi:cbb3-type cytochrome oxidase cytochrome c subunit
VKALRTRFFTAETGVLLFLGLFISGAAIASKAAVPGYTASEARGQQVFQREGCLFCHSLPGYQPTPQAMTQGVAYLRRVRTTWSRNGPDLALEPGRRSDDWHLAHLLNPTAVLPNCPMPSYAGLPDEELRALIAYLQTPRRGAPTPTTASPQPYSPEEDKRLAVPPTRASYLAGREIYRAYCAGCHAMEGNGAGAVGHLLWPEPRDFTDTQWMRKGSDTYLLNVIARGKQSTAMPGYASLLTEEEQARVLYYLKFYSNPSARQRMEEGFVTGERKP